MQGKIVTKIGLMVLVGWLAVACKNCQQEGPDAEKEGPDPTSEGGTVAVKDPLAPPVTVTAKYHVVENPLYLIGGASGKAEKKAIPVEHKPGEGVYKVPITLEVASGTNATVPITLRTNTKYFVYSDQASAEQDVNDGAPKKKILEFILPENCFLIFGRAGKRVALVSMGSFQRGIEIHRSSKSESGEFTFKHRIGKDQNTETKIAELLRDDDGPAKGVYMCKMNEPYTFLAEEKGLKEGTNSAPPGLASHTQNISNTRQKTEGLVQEGQALYWGSSTTATILTSYRISAGVSGTATTTFTKPKFSGLALSLLNDGWQPDPPSNGN